MPHEHNYCVKLQAPSFPKTFGCLFQTLQIGEVKHPSDNLILNPMDHLLTLVRHRSIAANLLAPDFILKTFHLDQVTLIRIDLILLRYIYVYRLSIHVYEKIQLI